MKIKKGTPTQLITENERNIGGILNVLIFIYLPVHQFNNNPGCVYFTLLVSSSHNK